MLFLALDSIPEVFFGGAAGGGKSDALLMAALMYVHIPNYSAIILRRSFQDLKLSGAIMDRAHSWLAGTKAHWDGLSYTYTFPSGAKLAFGYLKSEFDKFRYNSAEFQFVGLDEATQFTESQASFMWARLRRTTNSEIPIRYRLASNPGNIGHEWVERLFLPDNPKEMLSGRVYHKGERIFVPSKLSDNPNLDRKEYIRSLSHLDAITKAQYLNGDWAVRKHGDMFDRAWFEFVSDYPRGYKTVRFWDRGSTVNGDYTVGVKATAKDGIYYIVDVVRFRGTPYYNREKIRATADMDGRSVWIGMEEEGGSSGKDTADTYGREVLQGFVFKPIRSTGSKVERADPVSSSAQAGNIKILKGAWNTEYVEELELFPEGAHDDQVDATSGAISMLWSSPPLGGGSVTRNWRP